MDDVSTLIDLFRSNFPGATAGTPFIDAGMLPYWTSLAPLSTLGVSSAITALNTSRACTATAESSVFNAYLPNGLPNGDPNARSGVSHDVIHYTAQMQIVLGGLYFEAYTRALALTTVVPSPQTAACGAPVQPPVAACGV